MDTTTSVDGGADASQPTETTEAVAAESVDTSQDVTTEETTSQQQDQNSAEGDSQESQPDDVKEWAEKKGLPLDDPVKLAQIVRDAEKKMHEVTQRSRELETTMSNQALVDYTGNEQVDTLAAQVNQLTIQNAVNNFFTANPEAREFESKMAEIVQERPHLQGDLDALYALARTDPSREAQLKTEGGREALTNLAQKQQAVPPNASATNAGDFSSSKITPNNVEQLVAENSRDWYEANRAEILRASGMSS